MVNVSTVHGVIDLLSWQVDAAQCLDEFCGDGIVNDAPNEDCDDGNNDDGDGCSASCFLELDPSIPLVPHAGLILLATLMLGSSCLMLGRRHGSRTGASP